MNNALPGMFGEPESTCIVCGDHGHAPDETCSAFCDGRPLVEHRSEFMHKDCIAQFEREIANAVPEAVEEFATEPTRVEESVPMRLLVLGVES